jgi:hypothetical protein
MANETLLQVSSIFLFGREMEDLVLNRTGFSPPPERLPRGGSNLFIQKQLENADATLARIYAYSYEGGFYELAKPTIFLVHGRGRDPEFPPAVDARATRAPGISEQTGLASQIGSFAKDMKVWAYDKGDFTIRMDVLTGPFDEMLLGMEAGGGDPRSLSGSLARSSGAMARSSGVMARSSGVSFRRSGDE